MSNFDPRSPDYIPPGAVIVTDGSTFSYQEGNQTATTLLAASSLSATTAISGISNLDCKGALFLLDISAMPASGSTTVALKLMIDSPRTAVFAARAALSAAGLAMFMVYPGISASAGGVSCPLPRTFSARLSLSTGATSKECVLSLTMMRIK
jgi:hypothetical protein